MYHFIPADPDGTKQTFDDIAHLRSSFEPLFVSVNKSKQVVDVHNNVLGRIVWAKRPHNVENAPTMVQQGESRSLTDVLAEIDILEQEEEVAPEPVRFPVTPDEEIDAIVDWQLRGRDNPARRTQQEPSHAHRTPRVGVRRSHANCTHATAGEAGKKARAACRKARAQVAAAAS